MENDGLPLNENSSVEKKKKEINYKVYFYKSAIKFSVQLTLALLGFVISLMIWNIQFKDTKTLNDRKEAISVLQETLSKCYERENKTRRLLGFFSKRWRSLDTAITPTAEGEYFKISTSYRDMITDWNSNRSSISAKLTLTYGKEISNQFDTINKDFVILSNTKIEIEFLKNSIKGVVSQDSMEEYLLANRRELNRIEHKIEGLDTCMTQNVLNRF